VTAIAMFYDRGSGCFHCDIEEKCLRQMASGISGRLHANDAQAQYATTRSTMSITDYYSLSVINRLLKSCGENHRHYR